MDPNALVNLALVALNGILALVAEIRGQGGVTDAHIAAQVASITQGNDTAYAAIMAALATTKPPTV
jgi:hypothetical protein